MRRNADEGARALKVYLESQGVRLEGHEPASLSCIIYSHYLPTAACERDVRAFLRATSAGRHMTEQQVTDLIAAVQVGLGPVPTAKDER